MFKLNIFPRATGVLFATCALVWEAPLRGADTGAAQIEPPAVSSGKTKHWAYIKPVRPQLPTVKNKHWPRNPIDYFILAQLEKDRGNCFSAAGRNEDESKSANQSGSDQGND